MSPLEGFRRGIELCIDLGYDDDQIRKVVLLNAARALGIEADLPALHWCACHGQLPLMNWEVLHVQRQ